ncbi:serine/threonine protein kinase, CMGC, dual-specificity, partial [Exophiala xenobiotica]
MPYRQHAPSTASQSKHTNPVRADDLDNGGTNFMQRTPAAHQSGLTPFNLAGDNVTSKKPPSSFSSSSATAVPRRDPVDNASTSSTFSSRRRQSSIPSAKAPMGPRPLDYGTGKRSASNSVNPQFNSLGRTSAVASYTHELSINDISRFSFASIQAKPSAQEERDGHLDFGNFLEPTFNFDDFQDTIVGTEPSLNEFPVPRGAASIKKPPSSETLAESKKPASQPAIPIPSRKGSGLTPLTRKNSTASTASRNSGGSASMTGTTTSILRGRRQSHFPPNSFNNANTTTKAPRKSVGPGTFIPPDPSDKPAVKRRPSAARKSSAESTKSLTIRGINHRAEESGSEDTKTGDTIKGRPSLAPKRQASKDLLTPSRTPDLSKSTSSAHHTPTRRSGTPGRTTTPAGNSDRNRRTSVMPHHATGLGARTVSPTDARRRQRMSVVPPAPPIPQNRISQAPPTPQPEPIPSIPSADLQSPGLPSRKSLTPSSSRTTPDLNRKSYSSGQSLSSNTSYSSVKNVINNAARLSQVMNSSRLPTPKPRLDTSTNATYELEVPPVPAIPKAYESPGSEQDQPFFSARSSSLPPFEAPISASPGVSSLADAMKALETPRAPSSSSNMPVPPPVAQIEPRSRPQAKAGKKNVQNLRLPPLNLLPLSTPTSAKIRSLNTKSEVGEKPGTPPGNRAVVKTPSTPMTASKASFFSRGHKAGDETFAIRSSTSHHALRSDGLRAPSDVSPGLAPFAFEDNASNRNISPFVSSSVPKTDDFTNFMRPNFNTDQLHRNPSQAKPNGPRAPSFSITPKTDVAAASVEKQPESESAFSTSALRRKLSRKKSEPKVAEHPAPEEDLA